MGSPFLYGGLGHNSTLLGDFCIVTKAEIYHFYYTWKIAYLPQAYSSHPWKTGWMFRAVINKSVNLC